MHPLLPDHNFTKISKINFSILITKSLLTILFISLLLVDAVAQTKSKFELEYVKIATEIASTDVERAFVMADSLLKSRTDNFEKMKCHMLVATLQLRNGNTVKALVSALRANDLLSIVENSRSWKTRIPGFISTAYRSADLNVEARKYLSVAENENKELEPSTGKTVTEALILQEKAYFFIEEDSNYSQALIELRKAEEKFKLIPEKVSSPVFLATNNQLFGLCYLKINELKKAETYLLKALDEVKDSDAELNAFTYCYLGNLYFNTHRYEEAIKNYRKAEFLTKQSKNFNAKIIVNAGMASYYDFIGDIEKSLSHHKAYANLMEEKNENIKTVSNQLIGELNSTDNSNKQFIKVLVIISISLLLIIAFTIYIYKKGKRRDRLNYETIIETLKLNNTLNLPLKKGVTQLAVPQNLMTKDFEVQLLAKLEKLEEHNFFLKKDTSLTSLASSLNSNTKYVSYIINTHRERDFNNYVNWLRISYALKDIKDNPSVRKYKISYLSDKYGFSSHSKFASIFKSTTGISPSTYIENVNKDEENLIE